MLANLAGLRSESVTDGHGIRTVAYFQGCPHNCGGCHNPDTHAFGQGRDFSVEQVVDGVLANPLIEGLTLSGGEPFAQPEAAAEMARRVKAGGKTVWAYTGYYLEDLLRKPAARQVLRYVDVLVDGPFIESLRDLALSYRGSRNQRIIHCEAWMGLLEAASAGKEEKDE